jgi:Catalytic LigB subunit of aromatic ring-opening dioxygenase
MIVTGLGSRLPALFIGHGNPMNALADNEFTRSLGRLAAELPRPEAVLVVSAHWLTRGTHVLSPAAPRTIHDFGGFPPELYAVQYPAPGAPEKATLVKELLPEAVLDDAWGLDHASWAVLRHMWPAADVPVFELSLDVAAPPERHWDLGQKLAPLRDQGVLVVGSGNIVHSFAGVDWDPGAHTAPVGGGVRRLGGRRARARRRFGARTLRDRGPFGPPVGPHERPLPPALVSRGHGNPRRQGHLPVYGYRDGLDVDALREVRLGAQLEAPTGAG